MQNILYGIDLSSFYNASAAFEKFRQNLNSDQEKAGAVQAFEFSYEMAWKTMKRLLSAKGIEARSPRDVFREAASINMISNPETWFKFIETRNLSTNTYNENICEEVIATFPIFSKALNEFWEYVEDLEDAEIALERMNDPNRKLYTSDEVKQRLLAKIK